MSKYDITELWDERIGADVPEKYDLAGLLMKRSAIGNPNSKYEPTIDHVRPLSDGGKDVSGNIEIVNRKTNAEKADNYTYWSANGQKFKVVKTKFVPYGYHSVKADTPKNLKKKEKRNANKN